MDVFLYLIDRVDSDVTNRILIEDWKSVIDCLSSLDGTCESISIYRMRVCSNKD